MMDFPNSSDIKELLNVLHQSAQAIRGTAEDCSNDGSCVRCIYNEMCPVSSDTIPEILENMTTEDIRLLAVNFCDCITLEGMPESFREHLRSDWDELIQHNCMFKLGAEGWRPCRDKGPMRHIAYSILNDDDFAKIKIVSNVKGVSPRDIIESFGSDLAQALTTDSDTSDKSDTPDKTDTQKDSVKVIPVRVTGEKLSPIEDFSAVKGSFGPMSSEEKPLTRESSSEEKKFSVNEYGMFYPGYHYLDIGRFMSDHYKEYSKFKGYLYRLGNEGTHTTMRIISSSNLQPESVVFEKRA